MGCHANADAVGEQDLVGREDVRPVINLGSKSSNEGFGEIPTLSELGYTGYEINNFSGFYFMKGVDPAIVDIFSKAVEQALSDPDFVAAAAAANFAYNYGGSAEFTEQVQSTVSLITPVLASLAS